MITYYHFKSINTESSSVKGSLLYGMHLAPPVVENHGRPEGNDEAVYRELPHVIILERDMRGRGWEKRGRGEGRVSWGSEEEKE